MNADIQKLAGHFAEKITRCSSAVVIAIHSMEGR
jgi:hypothetical protein